MNLHDEPVFDAHAGHLGEHLSAEVLGLARGSVASECTLEKGFAFAPAKVEGRSGRVAVIGRRGSHPCEVLTSTSESAKVSGPSTRVFAGQPSEFVDPCGESLVFWIDHRVGSKCRENPPFPSRMTQCPVMWKRIEWRLGGSEHFDIEPLEERARTKLGSGKALGNKVVDSVRSFGRESFSNAEDLLAALKDFFTQNPGWE